MGLLALVILFRFARFGCFGSFVLVVFGGFVSLFRVLVHAAFDLGVLKGC